MSIRPTGPLKFSGLWIYDALLLTSHILAWIKRQRDTRLPRGGSAQGTCSLASGLAWERVRVEIGCMRAPVFASVCVRARVRVCLRLCLRLCLCLRLRVRLCLGLRFSLCFGLCVCLRARVFVLSSLLSSFLSPLMLFVLRLARRARSCRRLKPEKLQKTFRPFRIFFRVAFFAPRRPPVPRRFSGQPL